MIGDDVETNINLWLIEFDVSAGKCALDGLIVELSVYGNIIYYSLLNMYVRKTLGKHELNQLTRYNKDRIIHSYWYIERLV